jgi:hypothetical protein
MAGRADVDPRLFPNRPGGYSEIMDEPTAERVQQRAEHLLPEERAAGSDDAEKEAASILADSDAREKYAEPTPGLRIDHRTSEETVDP